MKSNSNKRKILCEKKNLMRTTYLGFITPKKISAIDANIPNSVRGN